MSSHRYAAVSGGGRGGCWFRRVSLGKFVSICTVFTYSILDPKSW